MNKLKTIGIPFLIALSAVCVAQDSVKIEPKWTKDSTYNLKVKATLEIAGNSATIEGGYVLSGDTGDDGYDLTIHHDYLTIMANDNEVNPPFDDYKAHFDKKFVLTKLDGGIQGSEPVHMFLIGLFFNPTQALTKDTAAKWEVTKNDDLKLGALKIETTYQGDDTIGKHKVHKMSQKVSEDGTAFTTEGTFFVDDSGHVLRADIKFTGVPIPAGGGDAEGKMTLRLDEK
ncbi:MAG: hypothetical protein GC165_16495 [Armatimonadetes bacterium]|nr:hypothetical protein [Armatimonadota bacterium]MBS1725270.1 hypothetical protein [Armatimonadota bacterium]